MIAGDSGGGYTCLGGAYQLSLIGKSHLPKLMILRHSQLSLEVANYPNDKLERHEAWIQDAQMDIYKMLGSDFEK